MKILVNFARMFVLSLSMQKPTRQTNAQRFVLHLVCLSRQSSVFAATVCTTMLNVNI